MMKESGTPNIAILASGSGTTADAYARAIHDATVNAQIGLVISSKESAGILDKVRHWNQEYGFDTQTAVINSQTHPKGNGQRGQTDQESEAITEVIRDNHIDLVVLLGYMTVVRGSLLEEYGYRPNEHKSIYEARMLNTHPGPLPETNDTWGVHASARVLELGLSESKHTIHLVSAGVDEGPIIAEHPTPVLAGDTPESLTDRIQIVEKATVPYAIDKFVRNQIAWWRS